MYPVDPSGPDSISSQVIARRNKIEMLAVRRIHVTSRAPRWLLISGSVASVVAYLGISRYGKSSAEDGNFGAAVGVEGSTIPTIST